MGVAPQEAAARVKQYETKEKHMCQRTGLSHESAVYVSRITGALGRQI
jgi:hypothetical protein